MIQYILYICDGHFSSMLAIISLCEFVSTVFKLTKNGNQQQKILIGYFSKFFTSTVMIERSNSLFPTFLFYPHTHTHWCPLDVLSLTVPNCSVDTSSMTTSKPKEIPIEACAFWTGWFSHREIFMEAHLSQEKKSK